VKHNLKIAFGLVSGLATAVGGGNSSLAQQTCFRPPSPVSSLADVTELLALQTPKRSSYVISDTCQAVRRDTFGPTLNFVILNRFPEGTAVSDAYVFVKSYRVLTSAPPVKISLSRGDGWLLPKSREGQTADAARMAFVPFAGSVEEWNAAHSSAGSPADFADRLKVQWHAFASKDSGSPSTIPADFWKIAETFDRIHGVETNYLIRFTVNTSDKVSLVPFQVYVQREVQEVQLTLFSNIDALSGTYRFTLK
jgi:hypothetical protein